MLALKIKYLGFCGLTLLLLVSGCKKINYAKIDDPAYLRVFNNLNYEIGIINKDEPIPFLTMLIDPVMDGKGIPVSAAIKGDYLDQRDPYAPPYPSHIGNGSSVNNPEYPGRQNVLVGPVVNGFDLSSWAQIPSGKHRVVFMFRPKNAIPFFSLEDKYKKSVLIDTSLVLDSKEVYTLHVLQKDVATKENGILLRKENFHKLSLSDSEVYVNFYNMSSKGFWQTDNATKTGNGKNFDKGALANGIKDQMNIFYTLYKGAPELKTAVAGYDRKLMAALTRNTSTVEVSPYYSFPLFADGDSNGITTDMWQRFELLAPGMDINNIPYNFNTQDNDNSWAPINCVLNGKTKLPNDNGATLPNMVVNIHSGIYNPRSFATVNTIEIVNGNVYLTTVQRKYAPPVY
ncbi:hypothetical protein DBR11_17810 [Pedobacter sp. HMWF019]|uniref:hypothetical protein n=1 Tax=Pedobacter sp. HMWF019 TaxID=2056856 RepID=UPI000D37E98D|nr:hypothetical protein [Pedobacter sp. HMWF019]PTS97144.1 hypothetical protein DBR11_17810 [Pedobacter sp. HMWF019]